MPILRSTFAFPVDVPPVCSRVMLYFSRSRPNALLPKSARPPSCLTVLTRKEICCFATLRNHFSITLLQSAMETKQRTQVKLVRLHTMKSANQYPSDDCIFRIPLLSIAMSCRNFAGSAGDGSDDICLAPFLFLPKRQWLHIGIRCICLAKSLSDLIWLCCRTCRIAVLDIWPRALCFLINFIVNCC